MKHLVIHHVLKALVLLCFSANFAMGAATQLTREQFEARYCEMKQARDQWFQENPFSSATPIPFKIIKLGTQAVPFIIEKMEQQPTGDVSADLCTSMWMITWKRFPEPEWPKGHYAGPDVEMELYVDWWKNGRRQTPAKFARLYTEWKKAMKKGESKEAQQYLDEIKDMGIEALPLIMVKIKAGDDRLISLVSKIMRKPVGGEKPTHASILAWWKANEKSLKLPDPPPVAASGKCL